MHNLYKVFILSFIILSYVQKPNKCQRDLSITNQHLPEEQSHLLKKVKVLIIKHRMSISVT
jgi:hypothetical protein